ncbi:chromosome transmission fidelity protein 8 homolog isoform X2 [Loxodonta africana]
MLGPAPVRGRLKRLQVFAAPSFSGGLWNSPHPVSARRTQRAPLGAEIVRIPPPQTGPSHTLLKPLPQLTPCPALTTLRPGPTCARALVLCPGSVRDTRAEVRRQCSRRRRRRREVRLSPVGRAAPRSAAAIAVSFQLLFKDRKLMVQIVISRESLC